PFLPLSPGAPVEPERGRVHWLGEEARQARGVQPAPQRPERPGLRGATGRPFDPAVGALRPYARRGHAASEGRRADAVRDPLPPTEQTRLRSVRRTGDGGIR